MDDGRELRGANPSFRDYLGDWVGPTYGVPVVTPIAVPGSQVGMEELLKDVDASIGKPIPQSR